MNECQHSFKILVNAFLHAQNSRIQPQLINIAQVKNIIKELSLPAELNLPPFPSLKFSRLITPIIFSRRTYLVYILQIPLLQLTMYQLYKTQPFPFQQQGNIFVYIKAKKNYIFVDAMRHKYKKKLNHEELQACLKPNQLNHVCQETVPILTSPIKTVRQLIHPSTVSLPSKVCKQRLLKLKSAY